jgi:hypothetical protein
MSSNSSSAGPGGATRGAGPKRARPAAPRLRADGVSAEARRQAAAVLEVLAGVRTPAEVAQQLAMSLTRYYIIEGRALHGLVAACEPRPRGRARAPEGELAAVRRECEQLRRQAARQQALLRVTERAVGLAAAPAAPNAGAGAKGPKKRRPRKPKARALQAAAVLQGAAAAPAPSTDNGMSP